MRSRANRHFLAQAISTMVARIAGQIIRGRGGTEETTTCSSTPQIHARSGKAALACVLAGSVAATSAASAGECPADKIKPDAREKVDATGRRHRRHARLDQSRHRAGAPPGPRVALPQADDRAQRHRTVAQPRRPAGADIRAAGRPSRNTPRTAPCRYVHKAGDIRPEVNGTSHWWKNTGTETVILYVGDIRRDPTDHNM